MTDIRSMDDPHDFAPPGTTFVFVKGPGKADRLEVRRPGRGTERIDCPKQRIAPHDMVHFAVEESLSGRGFMRRVAEGEAADFRMAADAGSDSVERLVEAIQGDAWSGGDSLADDVLDLYRVTCHARGCAPLAIDAADIDRIRTRLGELTLAWDAVPVGGELALSFAPRRMA